MSNHDDIIRVKHMRDAAVEASAMVQGRLRRDLDNDRKLNLSLVRLLEVLGEAAARTSERFRSEQTKIPWMQIIGLRNRLIHGYDNVDFDILWTVVSDDLPPLIEALNSIVSGT